jgi:DNA adenine methylase
MEAIEQTDFPASQKRNLVREQMMLFAVKEMSPPLKWAGGKRWLVPALLPLWKPHRHRRLVEPFVGGMAVSLGLLPDAALLNDSNEHLINFYRWLQRGFKSTLDMRNDAETFYSYRAAFNELIRSGRADSKEAAEFFYYLNRTGYNGLCRFNSSGEFNVPFGKYKTINYTRDFSPYTYAFEGWDFTVGDFSKLDVRPDDFIYADPPYDVPFTTYSAGGFSWDDQLRLAEWLASHPGPVVASNQATDRIIELYISYNFDIQQLPAPRMISCTGDRTPAMEMLATKGV